MTITDEQRKMLTEYLDEKWHWKKDDPTLGNVIKNICIDTIENRTYTTDADMMALFRKINDNEKFSAFWNFAVSKERDAVELDWLFYDPERFCCLVAEWLEVRK